MLYNHNRVRLTHLAQSGERASSPHFRVASRANSLPRDGTPADPSPSFCGLSCLLYALAPQVAGIGQAALQCVARFQTRNRYAIRGNAVEDVLVGAFCAPCSLVQESREIEDEEQALRAGVVLGDDVPPPPTTTPATQQQQQPVEGVYRDDDGGDEERAVGN